MSLTELPIALLCFVAEGCPACDDLKPKLRALAPGWSPCFPTLLVDTERHRVLADSYSIRETPTLLLVRHGRPQKLRVSGTMDATELEAFYRKVPGCVV